ncbi:unnamed protein product, partial [marine sediment metagenome]
GKFNFVFEQNFDMDFAKPADHMLYSNGIYEERKAYIFKHLKDSTKRFNEHSGIEKILETLKKAEKIYASKEGLDEFRNTNEFKMLIEQFYYKTGFIGLIDGKLGCLLQEKYIEYMPEGCKSYLCDLALCAEKNHKIHDVIKKFIQQENPDSFGYSRIIHILAHHWRIHEDLGISLDNLSLNQLRYLKEFIQKKTNY